MRKDRAGSVFIAQLEHLAPLPKRVSHRPAAATPGFVARDPTVATVLRHVEAAARRGPTRRCPWAADPSPWRHLVCGRDRGQTVARSAAVHRELGGNLSAAARHLGISRNTVYRALRRLEG